MTTRSTHRPPVSSASLATLDQCRAALAQALSELASFCRGQLHEVYKRCGKPGCACATDPARRHGPYYAWQRCINGRIIQRTLQPAEAARVREGIACYEHFQALHDAYVAAMEAAHMAAAQPALPAAQKKSPAPAHAARR